MADGTISGDVIHPVGATLASPAVPAFQAGARESWPRNRGRATSAWPSTKRDNWRLLQSVEGCQGRDVSIDGAVKIVSHGTPTEARRRAYRARRRRAREFDVRSI